MTDFYYKDRANVVGPLTGTDLREAALEGKITPETLVSTTVDGKWVPATRVKGLFDIQGKPLLHAQGANRKPADHSANASRDDQESEDFMGQVMGALQGPSPATDEVSRPIVGRASQPRSQSPSSGAAVSIPVAATEDDDARTARCPYCSEIILASAKKCKHCGEFLDRRPSASSSSGPVLIEQTAKKYKAIQLAGALGAFVFAIFIGVGLLGNSNLIFVPAIVLFIASVFAYCAGSTLAWWHHR